ncbi:MAG: hypothetical protein IPP80_14490 [Ignavibacteria bacterium]|nr:hypothetical protein [Ignavibacteria bacterium]
MRFVIAVAVSIVMFGMVSAQQQVPNGGLETWTFVPVPAPSRTMKNPMMAWTSGNGVIHVAPGTDPVCEKKTTEAHSGQFAAKLTTRSILTDSILLKCSLGVFKLNL